MVVDQIYGFLYFKVASTAPYPEDHNLSFVEYEVFTLEKSCNKQSEYIRIYFTEEEFFVSNQGVCSPILVHYIHINKIKFLYTFKNFAFI